MWLLSGSIPHTRSKEAEYEMRYTYLLHHSYDGIISPPKTNYSLYRQKGKRCVLSGNPLSGTRNHQKPMVERKNTRKHHSKEENRSPPVTGANGFYRKKPYLKGENQCLQRGLSDKPKEQSSESLLSLTYEISKAPSSICQDAPPSRLV